jgi:hypothetical protein
MTDSYIDLRFVEGGGIASRIIRAFTRCRWSHAEVLLTPTVTFGAQLWGGVRRRSTSDGCYRHAVSTLTLRIPCTSTQKTAFFAFLLAQNNKPYDWRAIVAFALGERDWREADSWFCSELDARAFEMAGMIAFPPEIPTARIPPEQLFLLAWQLGQSKT